MRVEKKGGVYGIGSCLYHIAWCSGTKGGKVINDADSFEDPILGKERPIMAAMP